VVPVEFGAQTRKKRKRNAHAEVDGKRKGRQDETLFVR